MIPAADCERRADLIVAAGGVEYDQRTVLTDKIAAGAFAHQLVKTLLCECFRLEPEFKTGLIAEIQSGLAFEQNMFAPARQPHRKAAAARFVKRLPDRTVAVVAGAVDGGRALAFVELPFQCQVRRGRAQSHTGGQQQDRPYRPHSLHSQLLFHVVYIH
ncbi:hypothetical protein SDC9_121126 [bioreactor metagenome]|uniref:Uncharacterized protein n=1 Tax=bioreactor metagenome TaxID=1076179 RepID=A0A645CB35_9ZZZZ